MLLIFLFIAYCSLFTFLFFIPGRYITMCALVPFVEHGWDAAFRLITTAMLMSVPAAHVHHAAEEDHLQEAEEQEEEKDAEAQSAERKEAKVMTNPIRAAITVHRRGGVGLAVLGSQGDGVCHSRGLRDPMCHAGFEGKGSCAEDQPKNDQGDNNSYNGFHFYLTIG